MRTPWSSTRPSARSYTQVMAFPTTNTGWAENGLRTALRRRTWGCWLMRSSTWPGSVCSQARKPTISWAASPEAWPAGCGRGFCPSALTHPTWSHVSSSGALSTAKDMDLLEWCQKRATKMIRGLEYLSCEERLKELGLFSLEKRRLQGDLIAVFQYMKGAYKKAGESLFTRTCSDRTEVNSWKLKEVGLD